MSSIAPTVARQALRIASRRYPSSTFARLSNIRRHYVSESKPSMATVDTAMDQAIRKDQQSFLKQTGEKAVEDATMPTTGMGAETMLSPTAGKLDFRPSSPTYAYSFRHTQASHRHGPGLTPYLPRYASYNAYGPTRSR